MTTSTSDKFAQELFDRLLISLLYLQRMYPNGLHQRGSVIMRTLTRLGYLTDKQRKEFVLNEDNELLALLDINVKPIFTPLDSAKDAIAIPIIAAEEFLIAVVNSDEAFDLVRTIDGKGHPLALTNAGKKYSIAKRSAYPQFTFDRFKKAWQLTGRQLYIIFSNLRERDQEKGQE